MSYNISTIADYLSFVGFFLTVSTFIFALFINKKVAKLKNKILFDTRVPELLKDLKKRNAEILNSLQSFAESAQRIKHETKQCIVIVESIQKKLKNSEIKNLSKTLHKLKVVKNGYFSNVLEERPARRSFFGKVKKVDKDDIWECYSDISALITEIDNLYKDQGKFDRYV